MSDDQSRNLLFVTLDRVQGARTSYKSPHRDLTPKLSQLAANATTYHQAKSPSNWSMPSLITAYTGEPAFRHQFTPNKTLKSGSSIISKLSIEGFQTALFSEMDQISKDEYGLSEQFDKSVCASPAGVDLSDVCEWMSYRQNSFASVHLTSDLLKDTPLLDQQSPSDYTISDLQEAYYAHVTELDSRLGDILGLLKERDAYDNTAVVVTSLSGYAIDRQLEQGFDRRAVGNYFFAVEPVVDVPLVVKTAEQTKSHSVVEPASIQQLSRNLPQLIQESPDAGIFLCDEPITSLQCPPPLSVIDTVDEQLRQSLLTPRASVYTPTSVPFPASKRFTVKGDQAYLQTVTGRGYIEGQTQQAPETVSEFFTEEQSNAVILSPSVSNIDYGGYSDFW